MLNDALNTVENTIRERVMRNANAGPNTPEGLQQAEDLRRLEAINQLRTAWGDPTRAKTISDSQGAAEQVGKASVLDQYNAGSGATRSSAASRGLLGSSQARVAQGNALAARDAGFTNVVTSANDQATAVKQADEGGYYNALQQVLASTNSGDAQNAVLTSQNATNNRAAVLADQNQSQFGAALSQAIGGFLTNGVAGGINAGFQRSNNLNDNYRQSGSIQRAPTWALFS